jgi:lysophospholipase L1-like esterase
MNTTYKQLPLVFPLSKTLVAFGRLFFFAIIIGISACSSSPEKEPLEWTGTWSTAQQLTEPRNMPPEPGLPGNTIRQIVHVSTGGDELRLRLSNAFGTEPVVIYQVHLANSLGESVIDPASDLLITFDGNQKIRMEAGGAALSDPFTFDLVELSNVAITMHIDSISADVTGHPGSRTTSFIVEGNQVSASAFPNAVTTDHWYVIDAIDVMAPTSHAAVAILGNSITDGRGSGTNKQNRWPDELARRLKATDSTDHVSVLNQGIGGNCVLKDCLGPAAIDRFERDVLNQTDVKWVIILEGINDIGGIRSAEQADTVANGLINAYQQMIEKAHDQNILVYGATLLPFGESFYDGPERERARQQVNEWIRTSGSFDAIIDFDKALNNPEHPNQLLPAADTGDHLHPNENGYRLMAKAVDLTLFID